MVFAAVTDGDSVGVGLGVGAVDAGGLVGPGADDDGAEPPSDEHPATTISTTALTAALPRNMSE